MKVLLVSFYFPPAGGGGVQRPLKLAQYLPALGVETHVLAPDDPRWVHRDAELRIPTQAWVHRARYVGPSGGKPAEVLRGKEGLEKALARVRLRGRRLVVPDENATWALTAALYDQITLKDGRVEQGNFDRYRIMLMSEMPKVEVHIVPSTEGPGGIGEPGTPPIAPAVANALFAATGKRLRSLPFDTAQLKKA